MLSDTKAQTLIENLTAGVSFDIPAVDLSLPIYQVPGDETSSLYAQVERISIDEVTDGDPAGNGAFDRLMVGAKAHLQQEYEKGRITGDQYSKVYIAMLELAMNNAIQFVMARESAFWAAHKGQIDAINGKTALQQQRMQVAVAGYQAHIAKAEFAKAKLSLALEDVNYDTAAFNLDVMLPKQSIMLDKQTLHQEAETAKLLSEKELVDANVTKTQEEIDKIVAETGFIGSQKLLVDAQIPLEPKKGLLLDEQIEAARAQTLDTRTDGVTAVVGIIGKQKDLYTQQITSYQRDAETKAAKIFSDAWITQKTIDEGLLAPNAFTNASLDTVLAAIKVNNGLDGP